MISKREEIIAAAVREFSTRSYEAASVNRIIRDAGLSKGTFYHYFDNKKALFFSIVEQLVDLKKTYFARMADTLKHSEIDLFELLQIQVQAASLLMQEQPDLYLFGVQLMKETGPIRVEFHERYQSDIGQSFMAVIQSAVQHGRISDRFPMDFSAKIIWFMMMHYDEIMFDPGEVPSSAEVEKRLNMLIDFLKAGFFGQLNTNGQVDDDT